MNSELYRKQAYYGGTDFANELATLMIPDVWQYVMNIISCFRQAHESKLIYCDITDQLLKLRKENKTFYGSFLYKVGSLSVDGRAYANRNIRDWCANMHKIADSILQIINIVYDLKNSSDKVKYGSTIKESHDLQLKALWDKYTALLSVEFTIDNISKHRLSVGTSEKFSPLAFERIDYFIKNNEEYVHVTDLISDEKEDNIYEAVFKILDYIVAVAKSRSYDSRFYVEMTMDPEVPFVNSAEVVDDIDKSMINTVVVNTINEEQQNGTYIIKKVTMEVDDDPMDTLYLATIYRFPLPIGKNMNKIAGFCVDKIDVKKNGVTIGYYKLDSTENIGVHFSKYMFVSDPES